MAVYTLRRTTTKAQKSNYELFNCNNLIYAIGAGITAAAGTRLALQSILVKRFKLYSFQLQGSESPVSLFIVTTSLCQDWVIARLLPSLDVVAISQAPSPESNPNSPLPVVTMVGQYRTIES